MLADRVAPQKRYKSQIFGTRASLTGWPRGTPPTTCPPAEARRILRRLEFHYTPKHASWLNMVEIEIGVLASQCLDRRIETFSRLVAEVAAWEKQRNAAGARVNWSFTTEKARAKMARAYPRPTNLTRPQRVKTSVPRY